MTVFSVGEFAPSVSFEGVRTYFLLAATVIFFLRVWGEETAKVLRINGCWSSVKWVQFFLLSLAFYTTASAELVKGF